MKYEVNTVVTPTQVATKRTTYCFYLKSVMQLVEKCTTIDEVQDLLVPVERAIHRVLGRSFKFSINFGCYGGKPMVSYVTNNDALINMYDDGMLYVSVLCYDTVDCITVQMKAIEESNSESTDSNKGEE